MRIGEALIARVKSIFHAAVPALLSPPFPPHQKKGEKEKKKSDKEKGKKEERKRSGKTIKDGKIQFSYNVVPMYVEFPSFFYSLYFINKSPNPPPFLPPS